MSDILRPRALIKMGAGDQLPRDLQTVFLAVGNAEALGHDATIESIWLPTDEPVEIEMVTGDNSDVFVTDVLDIEAAAALAEIDMDVMVGPDERLISTLNRNLRDRLGLRPGDTLPAADRERLGPLLAGTYRKMGGVAVVSSSTADGLSTVVGFYDDTRRLGASDSASDQ